MYHILKFYAIVFKFIVHTTNYKMVKSEMMMLTMREKFNVVDADVTIC
jgi:hypothetical protein